MTAAVPLHAAEALVIAWASAPRRALLPAPAPIPRLPAPPVLRRLGWVRTEAEPEARVEVPEVRSPVAEAAPAPVEAPKPGPRWAEPKREEEPVTPSPAEVAAEAPAEVREADGAPRAPAPVWGEPAAAADTHALDLTLTVKAPNPWAIMPSRTLRGAGARHLVRKADPLEPSPTLQEQVASEGAPAPRPEAHERLWDLIIVPAQTGFRASEQGVKALVLYLDRSQLLRSPTVSTLEEFVGHPLHQTAEHWRERLRGPGGGDETRIVSLEPGEFSHQIFFEGAAPAGGPAVLRGHIGQRPRPMALPFGQESREAAFWLALVGCRFDKPSRGFLERMHSILYLRPQVFAVPHGGR